MPHDLDPGHSGGPISGYQSDMEHGAFPTMGGYFPPKQPHTLHDNYLISVEHLPTHQRVRFNGWVTNFQDQFTSRWNGTPVYGRMDDLYTFQRTGRKLSLAFDVVAADRKEATINQQSLNRLAQFLYPVYSDTTPDVGGARMKNQRVLVAPPLLRLGWTNIIENTNLDGLVGFLSGFTYSPEINEGQFFAYPAGDTARLPAWGDFDAFPSGRSAGKIINYQHYSVQLDFTVVHTHLMGWSRGQPDNKGQPKYIFGGSEENADRLREFPRRMIDSGMTVGTETQARSARQRGLWGSGANDGPVYSKVELRALADGHNIETAQHRQILNP